MKALNTVVINRKPLDFYFIPLLLALVFFSIVIPNSFQVATALVMISCSFISLFYISKSDISAKFLVFIYLNLLVTLTYLLVGVVNSAITEAVKQVFIIYIISPVLWFLILTAVLTHFGEDKVINTFVPVTWLCCLSVFIFFYLFESYGASSVSLFKENANLNTNDGYSGATMHVYGSLIFMGGGFFAAPEVIKNKVVMILTLAAVALAAITSGRTAFIISLFIGLSVFLFFSSGKTTSFKVRLGFIFSFIITAFIVSYIASSIRGVDISYVMNIVTDKISSGGGNERSTQTKELIDSVFEHYGLGVGHGVGVDYIRSYKFPWRYETVWWATLHRVGILGAFIYSIPFVFYLSSTFFTFLKKGLGSSERFFLGGFLCAFVASNTNPYLEGMPFQWMYILPVLALLLRIKKTKGL